MENIKFHNNKLKVEQI